MVDLDLNSILRGVKETLTNAEQRSVEFKNRANNDRPESAVAFFIEGTYSLTSIGVWSQGLCDVDWLYVSDPKGEFTHKEFFDANEVVPFVVSEIRKAFKRERAQTFADSIR
jgi:hypothetical protein